MQAPPVKRSEMEASTDEQQLLRSCIVLFGDDLHVSREFLDYLQLSGLKSAYRKRALETHPDRMFGTDRAGRMQAAEHFHSVQHAYEDLLHFLRTRERHSLHCHEFPRFGAAASPFSPKPADFSARVQKGDKDCSPTRDQHKSSSRKTTAGSTPFVHQASSNHGFSSIENLYHGPLPARRLLFGHFLYYSGLANWRTIARILIWQKTGRPRLGELGQLLGMLSPEDTLCILRNTIPLQHFGQTAQRLGMLSENQLRVLMFHQQRLQKKFGAILLEKQLIGQHELNELLWQFEQHNQRCHVKK